MDYLLNREGNHLRMVPWDKIDKGDLITAWWRILMEFEDHIVSAPSKAWCFLPGASPGRGGIRKISRKG